jgi:hypothetical protein
MSMWHRSKNMMAEVATRERKDGEKPVWNGFDMCQTALELYSYETASWYSSKIHKEKMKPQKKKGKIIAFHIYKKKSTRGIVQQQTLILSM